MTNTGPVSVGSRARFRIGRWARSSSCPTVVASRSRGLFPGLRSTPTMQRRGQPNRPEREGRGATLGWSAAPQLSATGADPDRLARGSGGQDPTIDVSPLGEVERLDPPALQQVAARAAPWARSAPTNRFYDRCSPGCSTDKRRGRFSHATSVGARSGSPAVLRVRSQDEQSLPAGLAATRGTPLRRGRRFPQRPGRACARRGDQTRSNPRRRRATAVAHRAPRLSRVPGTKEGSHRHLLWSGRRLTHLPHPSTRTREESKVTPLRWVGGNRSQPFLFGSCFHQRYWRHAT